VTRVAAVDIGTNSTRLLVADVDGESVRELDRRLEITRLGEGVDERRILLPHAIARVRNVLAEYRRAVEEKAAARTLAFATSAVRDAENGEAFLGEIEWSYGFTTRLLSGHDEALLTFRGVSAGREVSPGTLVVDVGGGSTELSVDGLRTSLAVGSVRLTERFLADDPPAPAQVDAAAAYVEDRLPAWDASQALAVDGTVAELAALAHADEVSLPFVDEQLARFAAAPAGERRTLLVLEPDRAGAIVGGLVIVRETLRHFGLDAIKHAGRDLLDGAALEAAALPEPAEGEAPPGAFTCC
jgi:exopolyphosphatase / guanosine-5'-triphosphate,3'-diphosphate pyrophosphatase